MTNPLWGPTADQPSEPNAEHEHLQHDTEDAPPVLPADPEQKPPRRWGAGSVSLVIVFALLTQVALAVVVIVLAIGNLGADALATADGADRLVEETTDLLLSGPGLILALAVQWLAFIGGPWAVSRWTGLRSMARDFGLRFTRRDIALGIGIGAALQVVQYIVTSLVDLSSSDNTNLVTDTTGLVLIAMIFAAVIVTPFAEELFFRGLLLRAILRTRWGGWWPPNEHGEPTGRTSRAAAVTAIAVTSVIFGSLHMTTDGSLANSLPLMVLTGSIGVVLATVTVVTRRLGAAIIAHMVFNGASILGVLLTG